MPDRLRRELERWGFSEAEIDVYQAVLAVGEGSASAIGDVADVSARHVYRVCEGLEERGLVQVDDHVQPTRVRARPPQVVEDTIETSWTTMCDEIADRYAGPAAQPPDIEVLKRQPTVLSRAAELLDDAERWVIAVIPPAVVEELADALAAAVDRGVIVLLVTQAERVSIDRPIGAIGTVVRTRTGPMGFQEFGIGADKVHSLMVSASAAMGDDHRFSPALSVTDDTIAVRTNDSMFGIECRLSQAYHVPDPAALPFESTLFHETVLQAALHTREGTALRARVEGRSIDDDRAGSVEGRVVEVRQGFLEPYNQSFLGERTLVLETDGERVTVGGPPATLESYAAESVTLYSATGPAP